MYKSNICGWGNKSERREKYASSVFFDAFFTVLALVMALAMVLASAGFADNSAYALTDLNKAEISENNDAANAVPEEKAGLGEEESVWTDAGDAEEKKDT